MFRRRGSSLPTAPGSAGRRLEVTLGTSVDRHASKPEPLVLAGTELAAHKEVIGITGSGKSRFLASLFLQLLNKGVGVSLIDPAGDLCDLILGTLVDVGYFQDADRRGFERLWYVDFGREDAFVPFNVLNQPYLPTVIARNLLEAWKRAWPTIAGGVAPALEQILLASSVVLAENQLPITLLSRLLADKELRTKLLTRVSDRTIVEFFQGQYEALGGRAGIMTESTLRRSFLMTFSHALRYSVGQSENRLQLRRLMDSGISLLYNLGGLDDDTTRFLGSLLTVGYEQAALSRADVPEAQRIPHHLIVDEFSQFAATSETAFERVLALARKYRLSLLLAHQTASQVSTRMGGALQNATLIAFRLGDADAAAVATRLGSLDPLRVKYVSPHGQPWFMSAAEQRLEWEQALHTLKPREAFVRQGTTTRKILSVNVPDPHCSRTEVVRIKEHYAQILLTPRAQMEAAETTGISASREAKEADQTSHSNEFRAKETEIQPQTKAHRAMKIPSQAPQTQEPPHESHQPPSPGWSRKARGVRRIAPLSGTLGSLDTPHPLDISDTSNTSGSTGSTDNTGSDSFKRP